MAAQHFKEFERLLSLQEWEKRVLAWTVQAYCFTRMINGKKPGHQKHGSALSQLTESTEGKIVVYRARFIKLWSWPKSLRDQLIIELPMLNAFRTNEVATVQHEHIDFEHGDIEVFDSKKYQLSTVPLDYTVGKHFQQYFIETGITKGLVFRPGWKAGRRTDGPFTNQAVEYIWKKSCVACGIPYMPPRYGRAYKAVTWIKGYCPLSGRKIEPKSFDGLMDLLRHHNPLSTLKYLRKIHSYEDFKAEFQRDLSPPFSLSTNVCSRVELCPMSCDGCHCRSFQPRIEVNKIE